MSEEFNPYGQWLGLPPEKNRPNHYELLGLPIRESDSKAIGLAAEQAATRVRSFRPGEHAVDWARLLDEIQAAKLTLLDPVRKAKYDEQFAASGRSNTSTSQASRPQAVESTSHAGRRTASRPRSSQSPNRLVLRQHLRRNSQFQ
jgi:curved DNA-binding protein CbpA